MKRVDLWLTKPIVMRGYGEIVHIDTIHEGNEYIERDDADDQDIIFFSEMQEGEDTERVNENYDRAMKMIEQLTGYTDCNGYNLYDLNKEFAELLKAHEDDTEVQGESRKEWLDVCEDWDSDTESSDVEKQEMKEWWSVIMNAYDELCSRHEGLRQTFSWYCGAEWTAYATTEWDVYVGGDEDMEFMQTWKAE